MKIAEEHGEYERGLEDGMKQAYQDISESRDQSYHIGYAKALEEAAECLVFKSGEDRLTFDPACIEEFKEQPTVAMRKLLAAFAEEIRTLKYKLVGYCKEPDCKGH